MRELNDPDSVVRLAAVGGAREHRSPTRQRYLARMLADPVRARPDRRRARASRAARVAASPEERACAFTKALAEYVAVQTYNADRPEGRTSLANLRPNAETRRPPSRNTGRRSRSIRRSLPRTRISPISTARAAPRREAAAVLREGLARNPRAAELHHALGLAQVRQKATADSLTVAQGSRRLGA